MNDWTAKNGVSNTSDAYKKYVTIINSLILGSAHDLINGNSIAVSRLILSQLVHKYNFRPCTEKE